MPLVVVAGPSGSGKSTLIDELSQYQGVRPCPLDVFREHGNRGGPGKRLVALDELGARERLGEYRHVYHWSGSVYALPRQAVEELDEDEYVLFEYPGDYPDCAELAGLDWLGVLVLPPSADTLQKRLQRVDREERMTESLTELAECERLIGQLSDRWCTVRSGAPPGELAEMVRAWLGGAPGVDGAW